MTTVKDLEHRVAALEEKVLALLEERRWLLRAVVGVGLVTLGQLAFLGISELVQ